MKLILMLLFTIFLGIRGCALFDTTHYKYNVGDKVLLVDSTDGYIIEKLSGGDNGAVYRVKQKYQTIGIPEYIILNKIETK